jgi:preprotein translocase subunit SecD
MSRHAWSAILSVVVAGGTCLGAVAAGYTPKLGLDLQGGLQVVLQPCEDASSDALDQAVEIIRNRIDGIGVAEPSVARQGSNVVVELPGVKDRDTARAVVGRTAELQFRLVNQVLPISGLTPNGETTTTTPGQTTVPGDASTTVVTEASATTTAPGETSTTAGGAALRAPGTTAAPGAPVLAQAASTTTTDAREATATTAGNDATTTTAEGATTTTGAPITTTTVAPPATCEEQASAATSTTAPTTVGPALATTSTGAAGSDTSTSAATTTTTGGATTTASGSGGDGAPGAPVLAQAASTTASTASTTATTSATTTATTGAGDTASTAGGDTATTTADTTADTAADTTVTTAGTVTGLPPDIERGVGCIDETSQQCFTIDKDQQFLLELGPVALGGRSVRDPQARFRNEWVVTLDFDDEGSAAWSALTSTNVGRQVAIVLDGVVQSFPTINGPITSGETEISGSFSEGEAKDLALVLRYGALPVRLEEQTAQEVSATLGKDQLRAGVWAGVIGVALVTIYMLLMYRVLGLLVVAGLAVTSLQIWAVIAYLGEKEGLTLTLAGVTGLIVSLGVAVDSFIVYFERLKDELRGGASVRSSVERGFRKAWKTILAADLVSLIGALLLYLLAVGAVRGFAFYLGLATLLDLLVAYFFMYPMTAILARNTKLVRARTIGLGAGLHVDGPVRRPDVPDATDVPA